MALAIELVLAVLLMTVVTLIHGTGISLIDRYFRAGTREIEGFHLVQREFGLMVPMALCLLALHSFEILVFALFYLSTGDSHSLHDALFHSALAYTTMGVLEGGITRWALISAFEGLVGFLLIGWSSAVFVRDMERVIRRRD